MPITAFNSFTDGLQPNQRSREHFIANTNLDDEHLWVPYADGIWFQPCCFNVTAGGFSLILKGLPGSMVGTHYHVGGVHGYTMRGKWDTWSTIGLPSLVLTFMSPQARLTPW